MNEFSSPASQLLPFSACLWAPFTFLALLPCAGERVSAVWLFPPQPAGLRWSSGGASRSSAAAGDGAGCEQGCSAGRLGGRWGWGPP